MPTPPPAPLDADTLDAVKALARRYGATRLVLFDAALLRLTPRPTLGLGVEGIEGWTLYEFGGRLEYVLDVPFEVVALEDSACARQIEARGREVVLEDAPARL
jgi:hypothetical protein